MFNLYSPLEQFEVYYLIAIYAPIISSWIFALTNQGFYCLLTASIIVALHILGSSDTIVPTRWSISLESLHATLFSIIKEQIGSTHVLFFPALYTLFLVILVANLISNIPYNFALATSIIFSMGLSFVIWIGVTALSISIHKTHFLSMFVPQGTPLVLVPLLICIETISYVARAFSLGIRLLSNLLAGHILLSILSSFLYKLFIGGIITSVLTLIPFALFIGITGLEIAVSFIQAFVFFLLTCNYINNAIYLH